VTSTSRTRSAAVAAALSAAIVAATGCDEDPGAPTEEQLAAAAVALAAQGAADEGPLEPGDASLDGCLERLARETPASVRETIDVIGYTDLLRDTCRARLAEEERDPALCREIEARLVRSACLTRVAIAAHDPEICPVDPRGRSGLCVALAAGSPALCAAAPHLEREACRELLGDTEHGCEGSIAPELCRDVVRRHRRSVGEAPARAGDVTVVAPRLVVTFSRELAGQPAEPVGEEVSLDALDRGARVVEDHGREVVELADPLGLSVVSHAERPSIVIRAPLPPADGARDARLEARVAPLGASVEVFHPELGSLHADEGEVTFTHLSRELGGRIEGRFSVRCPDPPATIRVTGTFRTFVRDVAAPAADPLRGLEGPDEPRDEAPGEPPE
jgi:hypothetical protein